MNLVGVNKPVVRAVRLVRAALVVRGQSNQQHSSSKRNYMRKSVVGVVGMTFAVVVGLFGAGTANAEEIWAKYYGFEGYQQCMADERALLNQGIEADCREGAPDEYDVMVTPNSGDDDSDGGYSRPSTGSAGSS